MKSDIIKNISEYYSSKLIEHGATSKGVDWNCEKSHILRFDQLCKILPQKEVFSILDYGCGFGSLIEFLNYSNFHYNYTGFDISNEMVKKAKTIFPKSNFINKLGDEVYDFTIANGVFNVKLNTDEVKWKKYIIDTISEIHKLSLKGFSFNALTSYSDSEYMKDYLHYADPLELFDYCKQHFSKNVSLIHDYDLYEFTIVVKK